MRQMTSIMLSDTFKSMKISSSPAALPADQDFEKSDGESQHA
jgi:hypothetical protein